MTQRYQVGHGIVSGPPSDIIEAERRKLLDLVDFWRKAGNPTNAAKLESEIPARLAKFAKKYKTSSNDWKKAAGESGQKRFEEATRARYAPEPTPTSKKTSGSRKKARR